MIRSAVWAEPQVTVQNSQEVESEPQGVPVRKVTVPMAFSGGGKQGFNRALLDKLFAAFTESGMRTEQVPSKLTIRSLKQMAQSIRTSESVYLPFLTIAYPSVAITCAAVLGRFYKKPVIIHLINQEYSRRSFTGRFRLMLFKQMADRVIFTTSERNGTLIDKEISADFIAPVTEQTGKEKELQPRIAVLLEKESLPALVVVVKAFAAVKQKYPRAELVLLYDPHDKLAVATVEEHANTPGILLVESSTCLSLSDTPVSADMVLDFTALSGDRTALLTALAEGISVISFQSPDSMPIVTDNVEGAVTLRLDRSFLAGRIIRMIEHPETAAAMSREAIRLARRFSPSHFAQSYRNVIGSIRA